MGDSPRKMRPNECGVTRRGVTYCYIPELGVRFCPRGATDAPSCRVRVSGDARRGRWRRTRLAPTTIPREPAPMII